MRREIAAHIRTPSDVRLTGIAATCSVTLHEVEQEEALIYSDLRVGQVSVWRGSVTVTGLFTGRIGLIGSQ